MDPGYTRFRLCIRFSVRKKQLSLFFSQESLWTTHLVAFAKINLLELGYKKEIATICINSLQTVVTVIKAPYRRNTNTIMAILTNHVQRTRLIASLTDKHSSLDCDWRWFPLRLSKRQSPTTVLFRTTDTLKLKPFTMKFKCTGPVVRKPIDNPRLVVILPLIFLFPGLLIGG